MSPARPGGAPLRYDDHLGEPSPTLPPPFVGIAHRRPEPRGWRSVVVEVALGVILGVALAVAVELAARYLP